MQFDCSCLVREVAGLNPALAEKFNASRAMILVRACALSENNGHFVKKNSVEMKIIFTDRLEGYIPNMKN